MKILAPVNSAHETEQVIRAGADELYCGLIPAEWARRYTNVASANRREWMTANLKGFQDLRQVVEAAKAQGVPVHLALNALYTERQLPLVFEQIEEAKRIGVSSLIVADVGLLYSLKRSPPGMDVHISTGGTTFNSETALFYQDLGASRVVLPRHLRVDEIALIVKKCPSLKFEVFILNSGCKNIDGFCTFQHGVSEVLHGRLWNIPKRLNLDRHILNCLRRLPRGITARLKAGIFGIDSACLLNYRIDVFDDPAATDAGVRAALVKNLSGLFSLRTGIDPCGACRLADLQEAGVYGVKIVGRNYSTTKKVKDVRFLKAVLDHLSGRPQDRQSFQRFARDAFREQYGFSCADLCYYPDGM